MDSLISALLTVAAFVGLWWLWLKLAIFLADTLEWLKK